MLRYRQYGQEGAFLMDKKELYARLEWLDKQEFFLMMKDRWTPDDYNTIRQWQEEMRKIEETLVKMEG